MICERTGLLLDPYFSGTKLAWILDTHEGARARARRGDLLFGTVDSYLIWRLTGGRAHVTDATNAARTLLYDIRTGRWDPEICALLDVPMEMLPEVRDCAAEFGVTRPDLFGAEIPILGVAGDQQAATVGQACFRPGMMKSTYGTGCFALLNTGPELVRSSNRLLGTIAYQLDGKPTYALEGAIFVAGAVVQWLRDGLGIIRTGGRDPAAGRAGRSRAGCGARASLHRPRRALLERDLPGRGVRPHPQFRPGGARARRARERRPPDPRPDAGHGRRLAQAGGEVLRVDGGMSASDWTMQFLADILDAPVDRPGIQETTALGAAWLAGHAGGRLSGHGRLRRELGAGAALHPCDGTRPRARPNAPPGPARWSRCCVSDRRAPGRPLPGHAQGAAARGPTGGD